MVLIYILLSMYHNTCGCGEKEEGINIVIEKSLEGKFVRKSAFR